MLQWRECACSSAAARTMTETPTRRWSLSKFNSRASAACRRRNSSTATGPNPATIWESRLMAVSPARAVAFEILLRVEREESYAAELLHSARLAKLPSRDHGLATELVMGVLRWQSLLDRRLAAASSQQLERLDGEGLAALRPGGRKRTRFNLSHP